MKLTKYYAVPMIAAALAVGCGTSEDEETTTTTNTTQGGLSEDEIPESSSEVLDYAMTSMSSLALDLSTSSLNIQSSEHPSISGCSEHGEPWDADEQQRTLVSNPEFAFQTFYCQLKVNDSVETVLGALKQNRNILCDIERILDEQGQTLEFTEAGKEYSVDITITEACGWSAGSVAEMDGQTIPATVTATSFSSGDWEKKLSIGGSAEVSLNIFFTANSERVAFKKVEAWDNAERVERGDSLAGMAADATGTSGDFVTIDIDSEGTGTLRAELLGTYWGRRTRMIATGEIDTATGAFSSISEKTGITANFSPSNGGSGDQVVGVYGEIATVMGNADDGFAYRSIGYTCADNCDATTDITAATVNSDENYCTQVSSGSEVQTECASDVDTLAVGTEDADFQFLTVAKYWTTQTETYESVASWITNAGTLDFTKEDVVNKVDVLAE